MDFVLESLLGPKGAPTPPPFLWGMGEPAEPWSSGAGALLVLLVGVAAGLGVAGAVWLLLQRRQGANGGSDDGLKEKDEPAAETAAVEDVSSIQQGSAELEFVPSYEWKEIPPGMEVPPNLEYEMSLAGAPNRARIAFTWQLQLWSATADAFYRVEVTRTQTVAEVQTALAQVGPSLPQSIKQSRDWGPVWLGAHGTALPRELSVEQARLFELNQEKQLVFMTEEELEENDLL